MAQAYRGGICSSIGCVCKKGKVGKEPNITRKLGFDDGYAFIVPCTDSEGDRWRYPAKGCLALNHSTPKSPIPR